jgi:acyl-CoA reductase-like NAD-dependent aldehyde dehydrogenase
VLTPWNFPHSLNVMKVTRALAAGNTVVLKPSPLTPLAGLALGRIIDQYNDIPAGVVNVVTPRGVDAGKLLTTDPRIDMVSVTGSSAVGREVMAVDRLVDAAQRIKVGDPTGPDVQMGPPISSEQRDRVEAHVAAALDDGASLAAGGRRPIGLNGGFYCEPTILTDVGPDSRIAQEEVFGPVLTVLRYRDDDDAVAIANNSLYGLSGAVWGADVDRAVAVARRVRTGQIAVNGCIPGDAPFGGFNQSGFGRDCGGLRGLHQYMEPKAIGIPT